MIIKSPLVQPGVLVNLTKTVSSLNSVQPRPGGAYTMGLTFVVGSDESQDVLVAQHDGLVDLSLAEPGALLTRGEDLYCYFLSSPLSPPHLPEATLAYAFLQDDGPGYGPLHQQRKT